MDYYQGFVDAVQGALVQQRNMDILSNNLSNSMTPGFKGDRLIFDEMMQRKMQTYFDQGSLKSTGNDLDLAISGDGFFQVSTTDGTRLTRDGSFRMDGEGTLITSQGYTVLSTGGSPITLNPNGPKVSIDTEGNVYQGQEQVGTIGVVDVQDTTSLVKVGDNLFMDAGGGSPDTVPAQDFTLNQGALEMSNVSVVSEMVNMISSFRAFESYQKAIHAMQEMDLKAVNQVGKVG